MDAVRLRRHAARRMTHTSMKKGTKSKSKSTAKVKDLPKLPKGLAKKVLGGAARRPTGTSELRRFDWKSPCRRSAPVEFRS
jgi:hypothetical protein